MADVAQATLERNSMNNTISLIHKDSSQLTLEDLEGKPATLVVSEIVDSELLGEGILPSIRDVMVSLSERYVSVAFVVLITVASIIIIVLVLFIL